MDPAPVIFTNDSMFMTGSWYHNRIIYSSGKWTTFNFLLGFKSFSTCITHNIYIPIKGEYELTFYKIPEPNHMGQAILYIFLISILM